MRCMLHVWTSFSAFTLQSPHSVHSGYSHTSHTGSHIRSNAPAGSRAATSHASGVTLQRATDGHCHRIDYLTINLNKNSTAVSIPSPM